MGTNVHLTLELEASRKTVLPAVWFNNVSEVVRPRLRSLQDAEERRAAFVASLEAAAAEGDRDGFLTADDVEIDVRAGDRRGAQFDPHDVQPVRAAGAARNAGRCRVDCRRQPRGSGRPASGDSAGGQTGRRKAGHSTRPAGLGAGALPVLVVAGYLLLVFDVEGVPPPVVARFVHQARDLPVLLSDLETSDARGLPGTSPGILERWTSPAPSGRCRQNQRTRAARKTRERDRV